MAVRTVARRNWSARCEGRTVAVWTVRGAGQLFEIPAGAKLGKQRAVGRRAAATRGRSRYGPDDEAAVGLLVPVHATCCGTFWAYVLQPGGGWVPRAIHSY